MQDLHVRELGFRQHGEAGGESDEGAEGGQIEQRHNPQVQAFEHRQLFAQRGFRSRQVVHKEPRRQGENNQERYPDPRGVFQIQH